MLAGYESYDLAAAWIMVGIAPRTSSHTDSAEQSHDMQHACVRMRHQSISKRSIAHHRLAQLQVRAHEATNVEFIKVLNAAVVRLMGEIRRFALAIRQYRLPPGQKQFNLIKEQHIQVTPEPPKATLPKRSELNGRLDWSMDGFERNRTSRREETELLQAAGVVR